MPMTEVGKSSISYLQILDEQGKVDKELEPDLNDEELIKLFASEDNNPDHSYIMSTIEREPLVRDTNSALIDIYSRLRPGDPPNIENAKKVLNDVFFNPQHYDLRAVGKYKLDRRLGLAEEDTEESQDVMMPFGQVSDDRQSNGEDEDLDPVLLEVMDEMAQGSLEETWELPFRESS